MLLAIALPMRAWDLPRVHPYAYDVTVTGGKSITSWHGQQAMSALELELRSRWFAKTDFVVGGGYLTIRQPRSWFGHKYGDPDEMTYGGSLFALVRHTHGRFYMEMGTGPMWAGDQTPAATSHFNFDSRAGFGFNLFERGTHPMRIGYRFSHVSNAGISPRNPGMNISSVAIGLRLGTRRR